MMTAYKKDCPSYMVIMEKIMTAIFLGGYKLGEKLPSIRKIANTHGVSVTTVQRALNELEHIGLICTWSTNGKRITKDAMAVLNAKNNFIDLQLQDLLECLKILGVEKSDMQNYINTRLQYMSI